MRYVVLHLMTTLDGCVSGPNGELDWLFAIQDEQREQYVSDLYRSADAVLMGRETYAGMAGFWQSAAEDASSQEKDRDFARWMNAVTKYVFSNTLDKTEWAHSHILRGDVAQQVHELKQQAGKNIVLTGGLGLARTFIKLGLFDEYQLIVHPVVLGRGKRLFDIDGWNGPLNLKLVEARPFETGVVALHYQKI